MLTVILQQGINGIVVGSLYVLVALGLTLIYGVLVQINFAHADIVTLGAFVAYFVAHMLSGNYFVGIAAALIMGGVLGWLINAAIFALLRERGSELLPLIATIGVSIMLQNGMLLLFGPIPYAFNTPYSSTVIRIGSLFFTLQNLLIIVVSATTIALLTSGLIAFLASGRFSRRIATVPRCSRSTTAMTCSCAGLNAANGPGDRTRVTDWSSSEIVAVPTSRRWLANFRRLPSLRSANGSTEHAPTSNRKWTPRS